MSFQSQIKEDLDSMHGARDEFIDAVFIEIEVQNDCDWRKESGLLLNKKNIILPEAKKRIWGEDGFRVFLSHKNDFKVKVTELKKELKKFGISSFVAHEDIHATRAWQDEIENALFSMDALVALMTKGFHDSLWTDQEIGVAFGRGVPIIAVKLGEDPYGFIGKSQALSCPWNKVAESIAGLLICNDKMIDPFIEAVKNCEDFNDGNKLADILPNITKLSNEQANALVSAYNENGQIQSSFGFNGMKPKYYGSGLVDHLNRLTGKKYVYTDSGDIKVEL